MKMVNQVKNSKEDIETLKKQVENLNMATKINQMLLKQVIENMTPMQNDLKFMTGAFNDFQYRFLAAQKVLSLNVEEMIKISDQLKLEDWEKASAKDDADQGFTAVDKVEAGTDVIIITSKTPDQADDKGIFRSKMVLSETANPALIEGLMNKSVGETLEVELNGMKHLVTLLGVRRKAE